jgi:hypothetical protein
MHGKIIMTYSLVLRYRLTQHFFPIKVIMNLKVKKKSFKYKAKII